MENPHYKQSIKREYPPYKQSIKFIGWIFPLIDCLLGGHSI